MKKVLLMLLIVSVSCSTGDENEINNSSDLIIGAWQPIKIVEYPVQGDAIVTEYDNCFKQSRTIVNSDGTYSSNPMRKDDQGNCSEVNISYEYISQTWEKLGEGKYIFTDKIRVRGEIQTNHDSPSEILFPDNNTMRVFHEGNNRQDIETEYFYIESHRIN